MCKNWEDCDDLVVRRYAGDYSFGDPFPEPYRFTTKDDLLGLKFVKERVASTSDFTFRNFFYSRSQRVLLACYFIPRSGKLDYDGVCYPLNSKADVALKDMFPDVPDDCHWKRA